MSRHVGFSIVVSIAVSVVALGQNPAFGSPESRVNTRAAALVSAALQARLHGKPTEAEQLLSKAVAVAPDYAPARWQSGHVQFEGAWRSLAEVSQRVNGDARRAEYQQLRASLVDSPDADLQLAEWCMDHELQVEERYHWTNVLSADPDHALARKRLRVREYRGGLFTDEQVAEQERRLKESERNLAKYRPKFQALCRRLEREADRAAALQDLRRIADPGALEALGAVVEKWCRTAPEKLALETRLAVVAAMANMPEHEATLKLLDYSLLAGEPEVRALAAYSLRSRPLTDWAPLLMGSLAAPIEGDIDYSTSPDGTVSYGENLRQDGPEADFALVRSRAAVVEVPTDREVTALQFKTQVARSAREAASAAVEARNRIAEANAQAAAKNERVREVLLNAINLDLGRDPKVYWQAWKDFNELSYDDHPTYRLDDYDVSYTVPTTHSCFMAGTPVWTLAGAKPIEQIAVGDMVLSQHPDTGELTYRPVIQTTIGPPTKTLELKFPGDTIVATPGHRFWVNGRGWEMAKSLKPTMPLHAIDAAMELEAVKPGEELQCHNLVVDDFHNFFVGNSRIMVHDKTCPRPTVAATPGLRRTSKAPVSASIPAKSLESAADLQAAAKLP